MNDQNCSFEIVENFFGSKNKLVILVIKYFFEFFLKFLGDLAPVPKAKN
jgi:hypothetical protein